MRITYPDSGNLSGCAHTLRILPRGMRRQAQGQRTKPRPIGGRRGACGAWPGFEPTRRAKLAARTASGRAAAHGHTKQPGLTRQKILQPEVWQLVQRLNSAQDAQQLEPQQINEKHLVWSGVVDRVF